MEKRFFFDRVNAKSARAAVSGKHHHVSFSRSNKTESALLIEEFTATGAECALDPSVGKIFPVEGVRGSVHEDIMALDWKLWNNKIRLEGTPLKGFIKHWRNFKKDSRRGRFLQAPCYNGKAVHYFRARLIITA